jgi:pyruvate/2-oxoglutarate dehydrogenase complex dihydrolipoamide dehydrogenase (E3) component
MYDVIVIGAGSGGLNIAVFMNMLKLNVLLIDKSDPNIGGDCLNTGCIPSKALLHVASLIQKGEEAKRFGSYSKKNTNLKKVMEYVKNQQHIIREHENAFYFKQKGIDVVLGHAKFISDRSVVVNNDIFVGKKIIIATGSRPRKLDIPNANKVKFLTNESIFELTKLPKRLLVLGGGPIGIEMAQAFQRLGTSVTVLHTGSMILNKEDPEIAEVVYDQLKKEGVEFILNAKPLAFDSSKILVFEDGKQHERRIHFDEILLSIGRTPNVDHLDVEKAKIKILDNGNLKLNKYLQTTNKRVYVLGDAAGSFMFTHAAETQASQMIKNFFSPFRKKITYENMAWVTYTDPEIATFGISEQDLQTSQKKFRKVIVPFTDDDRAITDEYQFGKMILFVCKKGLLLGGSVVAPKAGEIIQELLLAKSKNIKLTELYDKIYPYPVASRINRSAASLLLREKLTPRTKKFLKWIFNMKK